MADDARFNEVHKITSCAKLIPNYSFYTCANFDQKKDIDNQKVQVTDEIKHDIWKHLDIKHHLTWQMMLDIIMCITFRSVQNKYPPTRFICQNFDNERHIDNQKVQGAEEN